MQRFGIEDAADIFDGDVIKHLDLAGLRIDRNVRGVRAVAVSAFRIAEGARGLQAFADQSGQARMVFDQKDSAHQKR